MAVMRYFDVTPSSYDSFYGDVRQGFSSTDKVFLILIGLGSASYLFWLSGYLLLVLGGITTERMNILFNADTSVWIERIGRVGKPLWMELSVSHPLRPFLWGMPARGLTFLLSQGLDHAHAALLAAKLMNAGLFGLAMGAFSALGCHIGLSRIKNIALVILFCGFSSNAVVASTDHFGISFSLIVCSLCAAFLIQVPRWGLVVQGIFAILIFGTTITNLLVPILSMTFMLHVNYGWDVRKYFNHRRLLILLFLLLMGIFILLIWHRGYQGKSLVISLLNFRLLSDPWSTLQYAVAALVYPIMAPSPFLGEHGVTLEPIRWADWTGTYAVGATLWLVVFLEALCNEWPRRSRSLIFWIALPWLVFNIVFHNLWGDEYFLFSPHWSWLFAFVLLIRMRTVNLWWYALPFFGIILFQINFFNELHSLLKP